MNERICDKELEVSVRKVSLSQEVAVVDSAHRQNSI